MYVSLQSQVIESLDGLSDDNLTFILEMVNKFMKPKAIASKENGGIKIGMFKGEKYVADDYDFDESNDEMARIFGAM